jgi:YggT family protein
VSALPVAIGRADVADYVLTLVYVYFALILIRILVSWFRSIPYHPWLSAFLTFVHDVTEPYLRPFRRIIPMARIGPGALDLSPMVATIVLLIVGGIVSGLIRG